MIRIMNVLTRISEVGLDRLCQEIQACSRATVKSVKYTHTHTLTRVCSLQSHSKVSKVSKASIASAKRYRHACTYLV